MHDGSKICWSMIKNEFEFNLKRFEQRRSRRVFDFVTGEQSWLFHHYDRESKQQWKNVWCEKMIVVRQKVLGNEWSRFSSWRSELIESIPLESRVSINARTVCLGSLMLLDRDERRQESVCWFCMMTMEDPIGLKWRPNIWLKSRDRILWKLSIFVRSKSMGLVSIPKSEKSFAMNWI